MKKDEKFLNLNFFKEKLKFVIIPNLYGQFQNYLIIEFKMNCSFHAMP